MSQRRFGPKRLVAGLVLAVVAASGVSVAFAALGGSGPTARDISATRSYVSARRQVVARLDQGAAAARHVLGVVATQVEDSCPEVLHGTPLATSQKASTPTGVQSLEASARDVLMAYEYGGLEKVLVSSQVGARTNFVRTARAVAWSDAKVNRLVQAVVGAEAAWLTQTPPDLCAAPEAWVRSDYRQLPGGRLPQFGLTPPPAWAVSELQARGFGGRYPERDVLRLVGTTLGDRDSRRETSRLLRLEADVGDEELALLRETMGRIERALGVSS
jgi:hypothetical protein